MRAKENKMTMKRIVILMLLIVSALSVFGQELTVKRMEVATMDLSASTQPRLDKNVTHADW